MSAALKHAAAGLLLIAACIAAIVLWLQWPRRLDLPIGELQTTYQANAGNHEVAMTLVRTQSRDQGPATLHIKTKVGDIVALTYYNYDTLMDTPAGTWHLGWVDGDIWPDIIVETSRNNLGVFVVRSSDGMVREMPAQ